MNSKLEEARDNFIERIGQMSSSLGLSRVAGQLYALLFLSGRPLSLDEMMKQLKISKGHVSTNIRALENWAAVRRVWVKGDRKDYYEADLNVTKVIGRQLKIGLRRRMDEAQQSINQVEKLLQESKGGFSEEEKKMAKIFKERLSRIKKIHKKVDRLLKSLSIIIT